MRRSNWQEIPILIVDSITADLVSSGTKRYVKGECQLLLTPLENQPDGQWKHVSISHPRRYPTWDEILDARYVFFDEDAEVFQVLPPKQEYVNLHPNCFHLWSPIGRRLLPK